jgi:hypothetical protein
LNGDGAVDYRDFVMFAAKWMEEDCPGSMWCAGCDLNRTGRVDLADLSRVAQSWLWQTEMLPGLIGHWTMDDNADDTLVLDSSGNEIHGTAQENTSILHTAGIIDGALTFNGSTDYVDCGDSDAFDFTGAFSLSAWVRPDERDSWERVVGQYDADSGDGYFLGKTSTDDGVWEFVTWVAGSKVVIKSTSVPTGGWQFVVGTRDAAGTLRLYVDGVLEPQSGTNAGAINSSGDLLIGANYTLTNAFFDGAIDDLKVFDRALSADEIVNMYNETAD